MWHFQCVSLLIEVEAIATWLLATTGSKHSASALLLSKRVRKKVFLTKSRASVKKDLILVAAVLETAAAATTA